MVEQVATAAVFAIGVTVGIRTTRRPSGGDRSGRVAAPRRPRYSVLWDPSASRLAALPGPLVYIVREWREARQGAPESPEPAVKVGWTGKRDRGAAHGRIDGWETGTQYPVRVEGVISGAPKALEEALHRALPAAGYERTSSRREWFIAPHGDAGWRAVVDRVAAEWRD